VLEILAQDLMRTVCHVRLPVHARERVDV
jgi:hypothetical protein